MNDFKELSDDERAFIEEEMRRFQNGPCFRGRTYIEPEKTFWEKLDRQDEYAPARRGGIETEGEAIAVGLAITFFGTMVFGCFIALIANAS